jgi:hypothetical protein
VNWRGVVSIYSHFSSFFLYPLVDSQYVLIVGKASVTLMMVRPTFTLPVTEVLISKMCCYFCIKKLR